MNSIRTIDIQQEVEIQGTRERVFRAITEELTSWWGAPFIHSDHAIDLKMEKFVGGKLYELLDQKGQGYLWGTLGAYVENRHIEIWGPLGMSGVVQGRVSYELSDAGTGTKLILKHQAMGQISDETYSSFSFGWRELLDRRLKNFIEKGEITGLKKDRRSQIDENL